MKLATLAVLAFATASTVFAGEHTINAVGRGGWVYQDKDTAKTGDIGSSSLNFDYLMTTFAGSVTPTVKYFLTTDLLLASSANDVTNGTGGFIDEAYITKSFGSGSTSAIFGKKAVLIGGREFDYLNFDRYSTSYFFDATPDNEVGLTLSQEFADQTILVQYTNGNKSNGKKDANNNDINAQSKFGYGVSYYGSFLNGMIKPIIGYSVVPKAASGTERLFKGDDQFLAGGIQFNTPHNIILETDYDLFTAKNAGAARADKKITSIVGLLRYTGERFSPFAKFIKDMKKTGSVKTDERTAYDAGVEFKAAADDAVRYHVVYSGSSVKTNMDTTTVKSSPKMIMVGLKFDAAILK